MANHAGFVEPQNQIARALEIPVVFNEKTIEGLQPNLNLDCSHPIMQGVDGVLRFRTSCTMSIGEGSMIPLVRDQRPKVGVIAAATNSGDASEGRVVVITSAGHIASCDDSGANLYGDGSNAMWTLNIVEWLAGRVGRDSRGN